jgi:hypothetical protein
MKTKLLKKVRRRFEIYHMPNGFIYDSHHYDYNLFKLVDNEDIDDGHTIYAQLGKREDGRKYVDEIFNSVEIFNTEVECINFLKSMIIKRLRSEGYGQRKDKQINNQHKKVWHV